MERGGCGEGVCGGREDVGEEWDVEEGGMG